MACVTNVHGLFGRARYSGVLSEGVLERLRFAWVCLGRGAVRQPKPKTEESNRTIAVPPFVAEVIRGRLVHLAGAGDDALLFSTRQGGPMTPNNVRRTFRAMLKSVGLNGLEITSHAFRRTTANPRRCRGSDR